MLEHLEIREGYMPSDYWPQILLLQLVKHALARAAAKEAMQVADPPTGLVRCCAG
jgi:hypothetical protein